MSDWMEDDSLEQPDERKPLPPSTTTPEVIFDKPIVGSDGVEQIGWRVRAERDLFTPEVQAVLERRAAEMDKTQDQRIADVMARKTLPAVHPLYDCEENDAAMNADGGELGRGGEEWDPVYPDLEGGLIEKRCERVAEYILVRLGCVQRNGPCMGEPYNNDVAWASKVILDFVRAQKIESAK